MMSFRLIAIISMLMVGVASLNCFTMYNSMNENGCTLLFEDIEAMALSVDEINQIEWQNYLDDRWSTGFNWFEKVYFKHCDDNNLSCTPVPMCVGGIGDCLNWADDNLRDWNNACR